MRRTAVLLVAAGLAGAFATATPASASLYCRDLFGIPHTGFGPVCTVQCVMGADPEVNPKDVRGTLESAIPVCPA